jgi:hypothetical protein
MLFGVSKAITERMVSGGKYMKIKKIYSINIVHFDLGQGKDYIYHGKTHFKGLHIQDELQLSARQREIFHGKIAGDIYPEYYVLKVNNFDDVAKTTLDEWIYFLKHASIQDTFTAKGLQKAAKVLDRDRLTPEERKEYEYVQRLISENLSTIYTAKDEGFGEGMKKGKKEGIEEGIKKGKKEGIEEGIKKGIEKGRQEGREEGREEREQLAKEKDQIAKEKDQIAKKHEQLAEEHKAALAELARLKKKYDV